MKQRVNYRLVFLLVILVVLAIHEVAVELRPSFLRPGLHLLAYVGNTADGTVSVLDLIKLSSLTTVAVGPGPSGLRAHPTRPEIWGLSSLGGYVWVLDVRTNQIVARVPRERRLMRLIFRRTDVARMLRLLAQVRCSRLTRLRG